MGDAERELAVSRLLVGVSAGLSLCGASVMLAHFLVFQESRRCGRRLLFCLHAADAGAACAWLLLFLLPNTREDNTPRTATAPVCSVQSYLLLFFTLASCLWTACFAFHLFQLLARRCKSPEMYEHRYHLVAWGIPAATVAQVYVQSLRGASLVGESGRPWCWLRSWSDFQWSSTGFYVQLTLFYIPVVVVFLHNIATYLMLLHSMTDELSTRTETRIRFRLLLYCWAFFLSNAWTVFAAVYEVVAPQHALNTSLLYLTSFFYPLQGATNTVAYGMNAAFQERVRAMARTFARCR